jgi:Transcriptional regulators
MKRLEQASLSERTYQELKRYIVERQVGPQEKLDIQELGQQLGVSRMPILDALTRLEMEGLVQRHNRVGTYITPLNRATYEEIYTARSMVEQWATAPTIAVLRDADIQRFRTLLQQSRSLITNVTEEDFQYLQFIDYDQQFHVGLVQLCQNTRVIQFYESLDSHEHIVRVHTLRMLKRCSETQKEHEDILAAFAARDVEQARLRQQIHLDLSRAGVLALLEQHYML